MESRPPSDLNERQANRLRILAESAHAFAEATTNVTRLLQLAAQRFAELVGDGCYIRLLSRDGIWLEPVATTHPDPEVERFLRETTDSVPLRFGEGISGRVVETGESVLMPTVSFEQYKKMTKPEFVPIFERVGVTSLIVVRLRARGINLGFIALVRNGIGRPAYTEEDLHLVEDLADRAALAINNGRLLEDLERRVSERTKELESANRELEAFCYSVSHDLRAPLRAIDGFSQILEEDHGKFLDPNGRGVIETIRRNARRMAQLIDDLLRFSRLGRQAMNPTRVPMRAMVESLTEELRTTEPSRTLDIRIGPLPPALCDKDLIRQVWINLLGNAVKYTRGRSTAVVEVDGVLDGAEIRYTVKDNGAGFDPQFTSKLFSVFQRLHNASQFEGTGVGLALVERIVSRHGGRVWAEGRLEEGATFGFALPQTI
ncbi:MAG TPA: ATP-binding protein [Polyangia bacterium]|nr:ATP-binding protein [Polyangia bacterium]